MWDDLLGIFCLWAFAQHPSCGNVRLGNCRSGYLAKDFRVAIIARELSLEIICFGTFASAPSLGIFGCERLAQGNPFGSFAYRI